MKYLNITVQSLEKDPYLVQDILTLALGNVTSEIPCNVM